RLPEFLDDPVEDDRQTPALATGQRVRVEFGNAAVRRPARVAESVRRPRAVGARSRLQLLQIADGANVVERVVLAQCDAGGVVPAVLEALESLQEQRLRCPFPDVSDDAAHPRFLSQETGP